jgi:hypothetical protein
VKVFFDNCVSPNIVDALRCLIDTQKVELTHLRDKFPADTKDEAWISALAQEGDWIIISGDPRISRGLAEKAAWIESKLTAFFFGDSWQSRRLIVQASELLRWWDDIARLSRAAPAGTGYSLEFKTRGPIQIYPTSDRSKKKRR